MLFFAIISIITCIVYMQVGIMVFIKNPNLRLNILYLINAILLALWSLGYAMAYIAADAFYIDLAFKISSFGYSFIPFIILAIVFEYIENEFLNKVKFIILSLVFLICFFVLYSLAFIGEDAKFTFVNEFNQFPLVVNVSDLNNFCFVFFVVSILVAIFLLNYYKAPKEEENLRLHQRLQSYSLIFFLAFYLIYDVVFFYFLDSVSFNLSYLSAVAWILASGHVVARNKNSYDSKNIATEVVLKEMQKFLVFINPQFYISNINSYSLKLIEHNKFDLIQTYLPDTFVEREFIEISLNKVLKGASLENIEFNIIGSNGNTIPLLLSFSLINDSFGDTLGIVVFGSDNREAIALKEEILYRQDVEVKMNKIKELLDVRVKERTNDLIESYKQLQLKIAERMQVEEQIKADITEKEILISEIINRVKSNMQIIVSLIETLTKKGMHEKTLKKFMELSNRVKSILLVHDNLYLSISYSYVDFASFINTIISDLMNFYKRKGKVHLDLNISEVYLDIDFAIPLGIVINEIVSNALIHGFPKELLDSDDSIIPVLSVIYRYQDGFYDIEISDNGVGFKNIEELSMKQTIGLQLIKVLVNEQINGTFDIVSKPGETTFKISFADKD